MGWDIIGDVHGNADKLEALLESLGYVLVDGAYRHPTRRALFLGDYLDRGLQVRKVLEIVRRMVEAGSAVALMGNHEFNAIAFNTLGEDGEPIRPHTADNVGQHWTTLSSFVHHPEEWREFWLPWLKTLPLWFETGELRAAHAGWSPKSIERLAGIRWTAQQIEEAATEGTPLGQAKKALLNGVEARLPDGMWRRDATGHLRREFRVRWWTAPDKSSAAKSVFPVGFDVPDVPFESVEEHSEYLESERPFFFGHYWQPPATPAAPVARNLACLDFSVARSGPIAAYRFDGEQILSADKFVLLS